MAINFDKALKRKGIKETSLDAWLEYYGKYRLSVDSLVADASKQQELLEVRKQLGVDPKRAWGIKPSSFVTSVNALSAVYNDCSASNNFVPKCYKQIS